MRAGHVIAAAASFLAAGIATAQAQEPFYKGRTVSVVIGYSAGGGYDIYARMLVRHIARHIPGNPTVVAQNMPGAGSLKALEFLNTLAQKDGLTMGTFGRTLPMAPLLEGAKFDPTRLEWVGSITSDTSTCVAWHTSPVKRFEDLRTKPFTVGGLGKGSDPEMFATIVKTLFAPTLKIVSGYPGTNDVALAMERGEVDGMCGWSYSSIRSGRKAWLDERKVSVLVQAALSKDPAIPADVPLMLDLAASEQHRQALSMILAAQTMARPFAMPPGTPKDRLETMRQAFNATMKDPEFVKEARTAALDIDPMTGEAMAALLRRIYAMPPDIVAEARRAVGN